MEDNIIRNYPTKIKNVDYPPRYTKEMIDKYTELCKNNEFKNNYKKWKSGINYKTNRKISINGDVYNKLKDDFVIGTLNNKNILFDELNEINIDNYLSDTKYIYENIQHRNDIINKFNISIDNIIGQINNLKLWNDFVIFDKQKYGIPKVYMELHRENDCLGIFIKDRYEKCTCHRCEDWYGCGNPKGKQYYKCDNCEYIYSVNE